MRLNKFSILIQILTLLAVIFLVGCSSGESGLSDSEKASKMVEVISNTEVCKVFKDELTAPASGKVLDAAGIDAVYFEALKAGCIKKDI